MYASTVTKHLRRMVHEVGGSDFSQVKDAVLRRVAASTRPKGMPQ